MAVDEGAADSGLQGVFGIGLGGFSTDHFFGFLHLVHFLDVEVASATFVDAVCLEMFLDLGDGCLGHWVDKFIINE